MAVPLLRFIPHRDYFDVIVENLTSLTVPQIQAIEQFATQRRSQLDFDTSSFRIYKRIDFDHFNRLLDSVGIIADTIESEIKYSEPSTDHDLPPEDPVVSFGKYKGQRMSQLPDHYLSWLKKNYNGPMRNSIEYECHRRSL